MEQLINDTPYISILCAPPKSGKTYLIKYLLNEMFKKKKLKYGIVFCPTKFTGAYDFLPNEFVHSRYNENTLIKFYNIQIAQQKKNKKAEPAFIIFDDCIGSINFQSEIMSRLTSTYRHPNFTLIFTSQYIHKIPTTIRECATYFITFKQTKENTFKSIQDNFMNEKTIKEVKKFITDNTHNYNFIIVEVLEDDDQKYHIGRVPEKYKSIKIKY